MDKNKRKRDLLDNLDFLGERYGGFWDTEHIPSFDLTQKHLLIYKENISTPGWNKITYLETKTSAKLDKLIEKYIDNPNDFIEISDGKNENPKLRYKGE